MDKLRRINPTALAFHCPGCECGHYVQVGASQEPNWIWNGSMTAPSFQPSIRCRAEQWEDGVVTPTCCHSFVTDGKIQFLPDSTHALSGQTVEIPIWE